MAAAITQELTFRLPQDVIEMLPKTANERHETPDQIVAETLRFSLQPVQQEALGRLKEYIREQQAQTEPEIKAHLTAHLTEAEQTRLSELLECNRNESLPEEDQAKMQRLFDRIEAVATEKAAAIWLMIGSSSPDWQTPPLVGLQPRTE